jgi:predicted acetyltransferase
MLSVQKLTENETSVVRETDLMPELRVPTPDDLDAMFRRDEEAFGGTLDDAQRDLWRRDIDLDRFRVAQDGDVIVGVAGSFPFELTLPGGAQVALGGTTWVSVAPTHRRQGLLRRLIEAVHADIDERDEPVAGLLASQAAIYERFGYGAATRLREVQIDRRRVDLAEQNRPAPGGLTMIDPLQHIEQLSEIYDRYRRSRVGELSRPPEWIHAQLQSAKAKRRAVLHEDGYAVWSITEDWSHFDANHELRLHDLVACTDEAHTALWNLLLSHDLVGPIRANSAVAVDDRLPQLLTDPRAVQTTDLLDFLWLCPRQVGVLLNSRRYRSNDSMVIDVDGERWRIDGGPDGAAAALTEDDADVSTTRSGFGSLILGAVSATELSFGGRLETEDLARADIFFGWQPLAHCTTDF